MQILLAVSIHIIVIIIDTTDLPCFVIQEALESVEEHAGRHHNDFADALQDAPLDRMDEGL